MILAAAQTSHIPVQSGSFDVRPTAAQLNFGILSVDNNGLNEPTDQSMFDRAPANEPEREAAPPSHDEEAAPGREDVSKPERIGIDVSDLVVLPV